MISAKEISSKVAIGLSGIALIAALDGCGIPIPTRSLVEHQRILECKPQTGEGPIYRFDTQDPRNHVLVGFVQGLEFYDLTTGKIVRLYLPPEGYVCKHFSRQ